MGLIDVIGHMGPTGLVVSGLASYVVWRHGPEVYHLVQHELGLPELGARFGRKKEPGFNKRTFWQKAWNIYPQVEEAEDEAQTGALEDIGAAARPEIFADPTQERSGPVMERITVEEAIAHTERNSYQVYVGRSLTDDGVGRAVKTGFGDRHMKFIGASQRGKSSMVAALLTTIAATHDPSHVQFAILDLENLTGRLFADVPHIKRLRVDGAEVRLHATNPDQVLEYLVYLVKFMEYRYHLSPNDLARQPILIVYIEEFLRLRRLFKARIASNSPGPARDAARRTYAALLESIDALAARGLKARIWLWLCAQVDYADEDLREALANVTNGMAFGLKTTAAQAAGFYEAEMLAENARTKRAGQCVVQDPARSGSVAPGTPPTNNASRASVSPAQARIAVNGAGPPGALPAAENPYHAYVNQRAEQLLRRARGTPQEEASHETTP